MRSLKITSLAAMAVSALMAFQGTAQAQTPEEFYKDKTVTLLVSSAGGTATDTIARIFADFLQKYLPGKPDLIVVNKPGAGGLVAAAQIQADSGADGTIIGVLQRNNLYIPLITDKEKQFDPRGVKWIGSISTGEYPNTIIAFDHSPVQTAAEIFEKPMVIAATSFTHENRSIPATMNAYLGAKFEIVQGYKGRGEVYLAMERKEADGWVQGFNTLKTAKGGGDFLKAGRLKPLIALGSERHPDWPDIPAVMEFVIDDEQREVINFLMAPMKSGRPFAVSGDVPADRVAALRQAFADTFNDPETIETMEKRLQSDISQITGEELEGILAELYGTSEKTLQKVRDILVKTN